MCTDIDNGVTIYVIDFFFFFSSRRRHTRLQGDWSSDVCSSDLGSKPAVAEWSAGPLYAILNSAPRRVSRVPAPLLPATRGRNSPNRYYGPPALKAVCQWREGRSARRESWDGNGRARWFSREEPKRD